MANTQSKKPSGGQGGKSSQGKNSAQSKKTQSKPAEAKSREFTESNGQVVAIVLGAVAAFLLAVIFIEGENVWAWLHNAMFSIFGFCAFVIPLLLIYMCIIYAKGKPLGGAALNLVSAGGFVLFLSSIIHLFKHESEIISETSVPDQITELWKQAIDGGDYDGGVIGAIFGGLLGKLFGKTGAIVTLVILAIVAILLLTGITLPVLASYIKKPVRVIGTEAGKRFEETAQRREELRAERERLRAEEAERAKIEAEEKKKKLPEQINKPSQDEDIFVKQPGYEEPLAEPEMPKIPLVSLPATMPNVPTLDGTPEMAAMAALNSPLPTDKITISDTNIDIAPSAVEPEAAEEKPAEIVEEITEVIPEEKPEKKPIRKKIPKPPVAIEPEEPAGEPVKKNYVLPLITCLEERKTIAASNVEAEIMMGKNKLIETLDSFKIRATVTGIVRGPSVTRYELMPDAGVRISKITSLADDIALHLAAQSVRIEAPIPGKAAIGIEIPNDAKSMVSMREIIDTDDFRNSGIKSKLSVALGKDITGNIVTADLTKMPHLLVAGTTGSGKSVCMNTMIISILYNASPDEVKFVMIDPKQVEFTVYNGIAHLEVPVVTDARKAAGALGWAVAEMEKRYKLFSENQVRDIKGYNKKAAARDDMIKMHHIVIFIDELSDLMMVSPKEVEDSICRLAQMARAAGIHLVIATQSPRADILTGLIKANVPSRIALKVSNGMESRIILDQGGAEKLLGNGDMLFNPVGSSKPTRIQGCFISDEEVEAVVNHVKSYASAEYNEETIKEINAKAAASANSGANGGYDDEDGDDPLDPMFNQAAEVVIQAGQASTTMLQRKLKLGYARASRVMDQLEDNGIVGPSQGAKPRDILVSMQDWYERQALAVNGMPKAKDDQMTFADLHPMPESEDEYDEDFDDEDDELDDEPEEDFEEESEEDSDGFEDIYSDSSLEPEEEPEEVDAFADIYEEDDEDSDEPPFDVDDEEADEPEEVDDFADIYDEDDEDENPAEVPFDIDEPEEDDSLSYSYDMEDDLLDDDFEEDRPAVVDTDFDDDYGPSGFDKYFDD